MCSTRPRAWVALLPSLRAVDKISATAQARSRGWRVHSRGHPKAVSSGVMRTAGSRNIVAT
jgi:hypothetical protein